MHFPFKRKKTANIEYVRSFIFGFEDSIVSTSGLVAGLIVGVPNKQTILISAIIALTVEALSMGVGQYLSENSLHEKKGSDHSDNAYVGAIIMFTSYAAAGLFPIIPLILVPFSYAIYATVGCSILGLGFLGYAKAKLLNINKQRSIKEMIVIGGITCIFGVVIGKILGR
jgi:VIT1/CCC1 family predicted Fe2+/Mn2+ transporter